MAHRPRVTGARRRRRRSRRPQPRRGTASSARRVPPSPSPAARSSCSERPSVAQRLEHVKQATEQAERRWTAEAYAAQQQVLTQLARHDLTVRPDYSFARVLDGFSATLDPSAVALLEHNPEVAGVYPVRVAYPAALSAAAPASGGVSAGAAVRLPGFDGTGLTIALLDTGVDLSHPYLGGRVEPGIDIVGGTGSAAAQRNPQNRRQVERHGTQLAGVLVGSGGPDGIRGVAKGASVLPIRIAGWQPTASGRERRLRDERPADRRARPGGRPERRRRHPRRRADRPARRGRAVRLVPRQPRVAGGRRRARARHARRRPGGKRRRSPGRSSARSPAPRAQAAR